MSGYAAFARYYDALTANVDYEARAKFFDELIRKYGAAPGILLDLACGTGGLSFPLARLGYEVIGADASAEMLGVAAQKIRGEKILFLNQSMDKLDLYGTVDATICALDSVNHIPDEKKLLAAFGRVSLFTNPGGLFIFDVNTPHKHCEILGNNTFVYDLPEIFCCWQNALDDKTLRVDISLDFFAPQKNGAYIRESESFSEWIYTDEVLLDLLSKSGFEHVRTFEADTLLPPSKESQRLVYVARKL